MPKSIRYVLPEAFNIEFDGIDAEHKLMVDILNEFVEDIENGLVDDFELPFANLIEVMKAHFDNEENYMTQLEYPGAGWHKEHHQECIDSCENLVEQCRVAGKANLEIVQNCFSQVIMDVAKADLKFREFLEAKGLVSD